jgi:hypothetical protein
MKKYVIKYADGSDQHEMLAIHDTKESAVRGLIEYIKLYDNPRSPFDFKIEEVECDTSECIDSFDKAMKRLGLERNGYFIVPKDISSQNPIELGKVKRLVSCVNPKHIEALIALSKLFTIAEAWNKEDGFVPDFADYKQEKWFPWFMYDKDAAGFVCASTYYAASYASASFGSRLCFKSSARAEQFGKQFADLYNSAFLR